jgi:hypothetical protein
MKNKILILLAVFTGIVFLGSCYEETKLYHSPESGDGQYAQLFTTEVQLDINKLDAQGNAIDIEVPIYVKLLGETPSTDMTIPFEITTEGLSVDFTPATSDMYSFAANEFVIPAGQDYGSVNITLINAALPLEEGVSFILKLADGAVGTADVGSEMIVTLFKKDFCPFTKEDLVGDWNVVELGYYDNYNGTYHITSGPGNTLLFTESFWYTGPSSIWGETVIDVGDPVSVVFDDTDPLNPNIYMEQAQYLMTTLDPNGVDEYTYWIADWNTYDMTDEFPWILNSCERTLYMNFYIPYGAPDGGLVDIVEVVLDYSGVKTAYVKRTHTNQYDPRIIKK